MATTDKNIVSRQQMAFHDQTMFQITSQCDPEIRHECSERIDQFRTKNENTAKNPQTLKTSAQTVDRTRKRQDPCQSTGYRTTGRADKTLCRGTGDRQEVFARRVVLEAGSLTGSFAGSFLTYFSTENPCLKPGKKLHGKLPDGHARKVVRLQIPKCQQGMVFQTLARFRAGWALFFVDFRCSQTQTGMPGGVVETRLSEKHDSATPDAKLLRTSCAGSASTLRFPWKRAAKKDTGSANPNTRAGLKVCETRVPSQPRPQPLTGRTQKTSNS